MFVWRDRFLVELASEYTFGVWFCLLHMVGFSHVCVHCHFQDEEEVVLKGREDQCTCMQRTSMGAMALLELR
jgi:hypothetical protein